MLLRCIRRAKYDYCTGVTVGFRQVKYQVLKEGVCRLNRAGVGVVDEQSMTTALVLVGFRPVKYLGVKSGCMQIKMHKRYFGVVDEHIMTITPVLS